MHTYTKLLNNSFDTHVTGGSTNKQTKGDAVKRKAPFLAAFTAFSFAKGAISTVNKKRPNKRTDTPTNEKQMHFIEFCFCYK